MLWESVCCVTIVNVMLQESACCVTIVNVMLQESVCCVTIVNVMLQESACCVTIVNVMLQESGAGRGRRELPEEGVYTGHVRCRPSPCQGTHSTVSSSVQHLFVLLCAVLETRCSFYIFMFTVICCLSLSPPLPLFLHLSLAFSYPSLSI